MKNDNNGRIELLDKLQRFNLSSLEHTFANFKKAVGTTEALSVMRATGEGTSGHKFILLVGRAGCGKTHLIEAVIIEWAKRGISCRYNTFSQIARQLKQSLKEYAPTPYDALFRAICERTHLVVDDFGMGTIGTAWEVAELEDIINERYHRRFWPVDMVTIMATNQDVKKVPERILSRFYDPDVGVVVAFPGAKDYRQREL